MKHDNRTVGWLFGEIAMKCAVVGFAIWIACEVIDKITSVAHAINSAM